MKKTLMLVSSIILSSCAGHDAPKCDDPKIVETVLSLLTENTFELRDEYGERQVSINPQNTKITNIMTVSSDEKLKSCGCQATVETKSQEGNLEYVAQENGDGEIIVKIDNAGPFFYNR